MVRPALLAMQGDHGKEEGPGEPPSHCFPTSTPLPATKGHAIRKNHCTMRILDHPSRGAFEAGQGL